MTEKEIYEKLSSPFPSEAFQVDSSRGFDLSSLKAQYIVERLNEVLGIGGWDLVGAYERIKDDIIFQGKLFIRIDDKTYEHDGVGHCGPKKNVGDQYKSAKTDCLSKTASWFGVGNECFKGLVDPKTIKKGNNVTNYTQTTKPSVNNYKTEEKKEEKQEEIPTFSKKKKQMEEKTVETVKNEENTAVKSTSKW
ncbi:MAG TPA: hypothetical protein VI911_09440 [Patescibacteria group bacterium]|nr:MAG: hypothetical protein UR43_C0005G0130 [candidate division TM6 bacterium GW2011_GWF2_33_332]HLD91221.1 hypothetical protein [Patescibacteria group bacterium]